MWTWAPTTQANPTIAWAVAEYSETYMPHESSIALEATIPTYGTACMHVPQLLVPTPLFVHTAGCTTLQRPVLLEKLSVQPPEPPGTKTDLFAPPLQIIMIRVSTLA